MIPLGILSIGHELLTGSVSDTNASHVCKHLLPYGFQATAVRLVGDPVEAIVEGLKSFDPSIKLIFCSGGLGPTRDDCTRRALSAWSQQPLVEHPGAKEMVAKTLEAIGLTMPMESLSQFPQGAEPLPNAVGFSPGVWMTVGDRLVVALPGIPTELAVMLEREAIPLVCRHFSIRKSCAMRDLNVIGLAESQLDEMLGEHGSATGNPRVGLAVKQGLVKIHMLAEADNEDDAQGLLLDKERVLREILGAHIFGVNEDSIQQVVGAIMLETGRTVTAAESCTGGLVANWLTDTPGSSSYFPRSFVSYSGEAKIQDLGVDPSLIETHGEVSEPVAKAMAEGARKKASTDFAIGITGIAGPTGGSKEKPVGLVHIAIAGPERTAHKRHILTGNRIDIKIKASRAALDMLRYELIRLDAPHLLPEEESETESF
ncbi:MAG: CinA family nicotinamide mononucleotide deamidase-related protein [Planctomycetota bacterium]